VEWIAPIILLTIWVCLRAIYRARAERAAARGRELHHAAMDGQVDRVRALLASGVDVDSRDEKGMTPLIATVRAAKHGTTDLARLAVVRALVDRGADVNARDNDGNTPSGPFCRCPYPVYADPGRSWRRRQRKKPQGPHGLDGS